MHADRDVDGELEDLRRGIECVAEWIEHARNNGSTEEQASFGACLRKLRAECGHFPRREPPAETKPPVETCPGDCPFWAEPP